MKTVSATEAKNRLGSLISEVADGKGEVVIEHHGRPRAVIVSPEEWAMMLELRERVTWLESWQRIRELAGQAAARNADLTVDESETIADEIADEAKRRVAHRLAQR